MDQFESLCFNSPIYFVNKEGECLSSQGFMDTSLYFSERLSFESQFSIQHKRKLGKQLNKEKVMFGIEMLIRHDASASYLCFEQNRETIVCLKREQTEECHFEFVPLCSYNQKGDNITLNSLFMIRNSKTNSYISSDLIEAEQMEGSKSILEGLWLDEKMNAEKGQFKAFSPHKVKSSESVTNLNLFLKRVESLPLQEIAINDKTIQEKLCLPLFSKQQKLKRCTAEKHQHSMWQIAVKQSQPSAFLKDNDYIYFVSSCKTKGLLSVNLSKGSNRETYFKKEGEEDYDYASIFEVEVGSDEEVFLKHLATGKYFPFNLKNEKKKMELKPLGVLEPTKQPPFHLYFDGQFYSSGDAVNSRLHAFWLHRINLENKRELNEILSMKNVSKSIWIPYLTNFLATDSRRKQHILLEMQLIKHLIVQVIPEREMVKECYCLLFKMCKLNQLTKKECIYYIGNILREEHKQLIIELLSELLACEENFVQKYITINYIDYILSEFIRQDSYSIPYLRIFRFFCGSQKQPCLRNQCILANIFFGYQDGHHYLSESVIKTNAKWLPSRFKYKLINRNEVLLVVSGERAVEYLQINVQERQFIRQYFYLLADTMNMGNKPVIEQFCKQYSFELLLQIATNVSWQEMKGPIFHLLIHAYLQPERKTKLYIFYEHYQNIIYKGELLADHQSKISLQFILFLKREIQNSSLQDYSSTKFRHLLTLFQLSLQNGFWNQMQDLLEMIEHLKGLQSHKQSAIEMNYDDINANSNFLNSQIIAINICTIIFDIYINLLISRLLEQIPKHVLQDGEAAESWSRTQINKIILAEKRWKMSKVSFDLCSSSHSEMMNRSLALFKKLYKMRQILEAGFSEARQEMLSTSQIASKVNLSELIEATFSFHKHSGSVARIQACIPKINMEDLQPLLLSNTITLQPFFASVNIDPEYQRLAFKLGIYDQIAMDLIRFIKLCQKEKDQEKECVYWKLVVLYYLVKGNLKLIGEASKIRGVLMKVVEEGFPLFSIAIDILHEVYRDNRNLVVSDIDELRSLCSYLRRTLKMDNQIANSLQLQIKHCKVLELVLVFSQVKGQHIATNSQLILQQLFHKEMLYEFIAKIKTIETSLNSTQIAHDQVFILNIFKVLLFHLLVFLQQKPHSLGFSVPSFTQMNLLSKRIAGENWPLQNKIFELISLFDFEHLTDKAYFNLLETIIFVLNLCCEAAFEENEQNKKRPFVGGEMLVTSLIRMLARLFKNQNEFLQLLKKAQYRKKKQLVMEKLFLIRSLCPDGFFTVQNLLPHCPEFTSILIQNLKALNFRDFSLFQIKSQDLLVSPTQVQFVNPINPSQIAEDHKKERREIKHDDKNQGDAENGLRMNGSELAQFQRFIESLIDINQSDSTMLSDELKLFFTNFLMNCFKHKLPFQPYQDQLISTQIPLMISTILVETFKERYALFNGVFSLAIQLLEGGNRQCQQGFLQIFKFDHKNNILQNILQILNRALSTLKFYYGGNEETKNRWAYSDLIEEKEEAAKMCSKIFRFLQLLCENDNHEMKNYIYSQVNNDGQVKYMSVNFIEVANHSLEKMFQIMQPLLAKLLTFEESELEKCMKELSTSLLPIPNSMVEFLIEVCQIPAFENQLYLCKTNFFDLMMKVIVDLKQVRDKLQSDRSDVPFQICKRYIFNLQRRIVVLLRSLLEEQKGEIIEIMNSKITANQLLLLINESLHFGGLDDGDRLQKELELAKLNPPLENVIDILIIKQSLQITEELIAQEQKHFASRIKSIEVNYQGHQISIYFIFHPQFDLLSKTIKAAYINQSTQFLSRNQKLRNFIISRSYIYAEIQNQQKEANKIMNERVINYIFSFSIFLCYLIMILQIMFLNISKSGTVLDRIEQQIISSLSLMQFLITSIHMVVWGSRMQSLSEKKLQMKLELQGVSCGTDDRSMSRLKQKLYLFVEIYFEESSHSILLFVVSAVAMLMDSRLYCLTLLFIFGRLETLQNILQAIRLTWKQIGVMCLLALAFSFMFGFLSINHYIKSLYENQSIDINIDRMDSHCTTIIECIDSLYTQKIIGETVDRNRDSNHYGRFLSDLIHWGFFEVLLTNIIAAIIIDKFAEQRNKKEKLEIERKNKCFICSADKSGLEMKQVNFVNHIEKVHNICNYYFYMYSLEHLKSSLEYTGIEYWIKSQIEAKQTDWIPVDESLLRKKEAL